MRFLPAFTLLITAAGVVAQQKPTQAYDTKRCTPKLVRHSRSKMPDGPILKKGDKLTAYPTISFQILESGDVANARIKRSSGIARLDNYALDWARSQKYNSRPGCGPIESQATVTIHFE